MKKFRTHICQVFVSTLLLSAVASTQTPDPHHRLEQLITATSLDREGIKPWHLHMNFSLNDLAGKPQEAGTVEEWFVSPHQYKIVIESPSLKETLPGTMPLQATQRREAFLVELLLREVVHPISTSLLASDLKLTDTPVTYSGAKLECVSAFRPLPDEQGDPTLLPGPKFCTQPDTNVLRMAFDEGDLSVVRNKLGAFLATQLALDNSVSLNGRLAITGMVDKLEAFDPQKTAIDAFPAAAQPPVFMPGIVVTGKVLVHDPPPIPVGAAANHINGVVVLATTIDKQGRVIEATVIASPNPILSGAASNAIGLWTYSPFLVNGSVAEVHSVVTVHFGEVEAPQSGKRR